MHTPPLGPSPELDVFNQEALYPEYTFSGFAITDRTWFAYKAALAIAKGPFKRSYPLLLSGEGGSGKTHLLRAILRGAEESVPGLRVTYLSARPFLTKWDHLTRCGREEDFRGEREENDLFLFDDLHLLESALAAKELLFRILDAIHNRRRTRIILSSRHPVNPGLWQELRKHYRWIRLQRIYPADLFTKKAILQRMAHRKNLDISSDVALFIAENIPIDGNIEDLLTRVRERGDLNGHPVTLQVAREVLTQMGAVLNTPRHPIPPGLLGGSVTGTQSPFIPPTPNNQDRNLPTFKGKEIQRWDAETKARTLLEQLIPSQLFNLRRGYVEVKSTLDPDWIYRVHRGPGSFLTHVFKNGRLIGRYCLVFSRDGIPPSDRLLAEYFLIRGDEAIFKRTANFRRPD